MRTMTLKEYAKQEGITIGAAYARIWNGKVAAERVDGRWQIPLPNPIAAAHTSGPGTPSGKEAQIVVLQHNGKTCQARELPEEELEEHREAIKNAERHLASFREPFQETAEASPKIPTPNLPQQK